MTSTQPSTSTSVAIRAAEVRTYWAQVPARINASSKQLIEKSNNSAGWFATASAGAAVATVAGSVMASMGSKLAVSLVSGASPATVSMAAALGLAAGAAPAVAGWVSALTKDGPARGVLEGAAAAGVFFVGLLGGVASGWTDGAVWLGGVSGGLAALAYAAGVVKRM